MSDQVIRRRPAIFSIEGKVTKSGAGWVLVEGLSEVEKHVVTQRDAQGNPFSTEVLYHPYCVLVTFQKSSDFHSRITANKPMRFHVEASVGWDEKFKRTVPRFWLNDVEPIDQESVFDEVKRMILKEDKPESTTHSPNRETAAKQREESPAQPEENVTVKPRPTRSSRYVK